MKVKKLVDYAIIPTKAHPSDAGWDLYFSGGIFLPPRHKKKIGIGVAVNFDKGTFGLIKERSGLADKHGLQILGGVIDENYTGEIFVVLHNTSNNTSVTLPPKSKIAQLLVLPSIQVKLEEVDKLEETERGTKGFGSSGV